jgi:hypothetical protein
MDVRILNLDGSLSAQRGIHAQRNVPTYELHHWGPLLRIACGFSRFACFEAELQSTLGGPTDSEPVFTLYGSGDFHHVTLALLRRQSSPFNLLLLDKHPDWMRLIPFLHCGTWLDHAGRLSNLRTIYHVGGDLDFDNYYRPLAPWRWLRSGKVVTFPAVRRFRGGGWSHVLAEPLRTDPTTPVDRRRIERLLMPHRRDLSARPLYVSVDKDVMLASEALVNWDSGFLDLAEVSTVLECFLDAAEGRISGADTTGDWSPVRLEGWFRKAFHFAEHPRLMVDAAESTERNLRVNLALLDVIQRFHGSHTSLDQKHKPAA